MRRRYSILASGLFFILLIVLLVDRSGLKATALPSGSRDDRSPSTIKFSHRAHAVAGASDCAICHADAPTSTKASDNLFGDKQTCATCHEVEDTLQCLKCHFENTQAVKYVNPPREIIFSHATHVTDAMECAVCHQGVDTVAFATEPGLPKMETCNTCHNNRRVTNTCESCHTNFASLFPVNHQRSDFLHGHRDDIRLGSLETTCQTCHAETFCQDCHQGAGLKQFGKRDLMSDPGPKRSVKDSDRQTTLQNVHGLNFRFTHGIDARAKQTECASCHEAQTFCVECHQTGGNITQLRFKPTSHTVAGFTTLSRGSGGGLHAQEARRDIENCMSCHDVEGRDPSCMTCHTESGQVR